MKLSKWYVDFYDTQTMSSLFKLNECSGARSCHVSYGRTQFIVIILHTVFSSRIINNWKNLLSDIAFVEPLTTFKNLPDKPWECVYSALTTDENKPGQQHAAFKHEPVKG